jgi:hypothetical protein
LKKKHIILSSLFLAFRLFAQSQTWQAQPPSNISFTGGNVGIGTTTPITQLHISSASSYASMLLGNSDANGFVITKEASDNSFNIWSGPFGTGSINRFKIANNGNVGLGTGTPVTQFNISSPNSYASMLLGNNDANGFVITKEASDNSFNIWSGPFGIGSINRFKISNNGNVLIGKMTQTNTSYILDVNGFVRANKLVVNTTGADYVFENGYHLRSLKDLDKYVKENHHLPDVTPAKQMNEQGLDVGDNQTLLLKKIEELTLYILQQQKEMEELKTKINRLERQH